jgi:hypothetical protein
MSRKFEPDSERDSMTWSVKTGPLLLAQIENYFYAVFSRKLLKESFLASVIHSWQQFSARPAKIAKLLEKKSKCELGCKHIFCKL